MHGVCDSKFLSSLYYAHTLLGRATMPPIKPFRMFYHLQSQRATVLPEKCTGGCILGPENLYFFAGNTDILFMTL